jgi:BirA family biotin operon repressor/biotin-[acetyl-CoA-carboxylase] ligase
MNSPLRLGPWVTLAEAASTQDLAAALLRREDESAIPGVIQARYQFAGRGRRQRTWLSQPGEGLAMSLIFRDYPAHPKPHLIGMTVAVAVARVIGCRLRWPNDVTFEGRKVGGILTELYPDAQDRPVAVVGVGLNLNERHFPPDIAHLATSLTLEKGGEYEPEAMGRRILAELPELPEPNAWSDLAPYWGPFDATPGKRYLQADGREAIGIEIGSEGELIAECEGVTVRILAAEALFA